MSAFVYCEEPRIVWSFEIENFYGYPLPPHVVLYSFR